MAPISADTLPEGRDWGYQLKWDGVRILAELDGQGSVRLFSRTMLAKNHVYPEIAAILKGLSDELGPCLLDGEVIWWDGRRPSFQQVLKRERSRSRSAGTIAGASPGADAALTVPESHAAHEQTPAFDPANGPEAAAGSRPAVSGPSLETGLHYVLFDLLADESGDLRELPYSERNRRLARKCPRRHPRLFATDLYLDGGSLWSWVEAGRWEGVVAKRLSSPYREAKKHRDWFKKKTALLLDVEIVGLKWRNGIVASLVMAYGGGYLGSVSLGLNDELRGALAAAFRPDRTKPPAAGVCPFERLPDDLKREQVQWLPVPFLCRVTGLEITAAGQLRHPKLVTFLPKETQP